MARDSLFGESIVWTGKPAVLRTPPVYRALAGAAASMALVTLLFALVVALALHANVNGMIPTRVVHANVARRRPKTAAARLTAQNGNTGTSRRNSK